MNTYKSLFASDMEIFLKQPWQSIQNEIKTFKYKVAFMPAITMELQDRT